MGMNYYLKSTPCECCNRNDKPKHIGKSSYGWHFLLHVIPEENLNSLDDWKKLFDDKNYHITDEENRIITKEKMLKIITERSHESKPSKDYSKLGYKSEEEFHKINYSERGLNNLLRCKNDGIYCVGHGEGTWDLIPGEFS